MKHIVNFINLTITCGILEEYEIYYFHLHPKAKKKPLDQPYHPSINQWMVMKRPQMNSVKQKWKDFMVWFINHSGCSNLKLEEIEMTFTTYFKTKIRHDTDNTVPKFMLDGFVESGFIVDDDSEHLKSLTLKCNYDKNNPRTEIEIKILNKNEVN